LFVGEFGDLGPRPLACSIGMAQMLPEVEVNKRILVEGLGFASLALPEQLMLPYRNLGLASFWRVAPLTLTFGWAGFNLDL
jgi:hypothetical protein